MPLRIRESPEPLSPASYDLAQECVLVDSDAYRLLVQELRRYCRREVTGRSFLISGHRGSGKTTLVSNAFLEVWKESERSLSRVRPLLVQLHGPNLLPDPELLGGGRTGFSEGREGDGKGEDEPETPTGESDAFLALKQITLSLHRALVKEVAAAYRKRVLEATSAGEPRRAELLELAAQLEVELWECPGPARLREFWARGGFLHTGVLFRGVSEGGAGTDTDRPAAEPDQGFRELLAISGVCEAYRRISGKYELEEKALESAEKKLQASLTADAGKDLFGPLMSLLTGGLTGAGLFAAKQGGLPATLGGIAAALGAATVFKYSALRSRDRKVSREYSFIFDLSVATLDRVLPMLIERLLNAGLAPVFTVDELDKVADLSDRILGMVHQLKKFVAESAFFCFLTDRSYFERMTRRSTEDAYPVEYTYFTHQLFIVFSPADLHRYLERVLEPPPPPATAGAGAEAAVAAPATGSEDHADHPIVPFVLLHRSQMHTLDLRRMIAGWRGTDGNLALAPGVVRGPAYRLDLMIQTAVEVVLDRGHLWARMDREKEFRRVAHDALYYPTRRWRQGLVLDLGEAALDEFRSYLKERVGREVRRADPGLPEEDGEQPEPDPVGEEDVRFLYGEVRELAVLLSDWRRFKVELDRWGGPGTGHPWRSVKQLLLDALKLEQLEASPLLVPDGEEDGWRFRWCFDMSGRPCPPPGREGTAPPGAETAPPAEEWRADLEFVERFAEVLAEVTPAQPAFGRLASELRVIATSPGWLEVEKAIERLKTLTPPYPEYQTDVACVREFAALLRESVITITLALLCGGAVGRASPLRTPGDRTWAGLEAISRAYQFAEKDAEGVEEALARTANTLSALGLDWPHDELSTVPAPQEAAELDAWHGGVRRAVEAMGAEPIPGVQMAKLRRLAWRSAWTRLTSHIVGGNRVQPNLAEPITEVAGDAPGTLLGYDFQRLTVARWSSALVAGLARTPRRPKLPPLWLIPAALHALGFRVPSWDALRSWLLERGVTQPVGGEADALPPDFALLERALAQGAERSALVVRRSSGSVTEGWLPSPSTAVVVVTREQAEDLLRPFSSVGRKILPEVARHLTSLPPPPLGSPLQCIAFEMPLDRRVQQRLVKEVMGAVTSMWPAGVPGPPEPLYIYPETPREKAPGKFVVAPRSVDELFPTFTTSSP